MKLPTRVEPRGRTFQIIDDAGYVMCDVITGDTALTMQQIAQRISAALNAAMEPTAGWRAWYTDDRGTRHERVFDFERDAMAWATKHSTLGGIEPLVLMSVGEMIERLSEVIVP